MNKTGKCYVYVYLNPLKPGKYYYEGSSVAFLYEPFYVGKGTNNRMYQHIRQSTPGTAKYNTIKEVQASGYNQKDYIIKVADGMSDEVALEVESKLVDIIGRQRKNTGPLVNVAAGGGGSFTGRHRRDYKITEQVISYVLENYKLGKTMKDIAKVLDFSVSTVNRILVEAGIKVKAPHLGVGLALSRNCDNIRKMIKSGVRVSDIAKMFNTSRQTIYTFMEQNHIPSRLQMSRGEVA